MADTERTKAELLALFAEGQPIGSITPQDMRDYVVTTDIVNTRFSTALIKGGEVTVNGGDNAKFDIAAGQGFYVDNFTDPQNPVRIKVSWNAFVAQTVPDIATQPLTYLGLDLSTGSAVPVLQSTSFTVAQSRVIILLAILLHEDMATLNAVIPQYSYAFDIQKNLEDLARFIGSINVSGNVYSPNGANLQLDKSAGETFTLGQNYDVSRQVPNNRTNPPVVGLTFTYVYQDGLGGFTSVPGQTSIDATRYDDGSGTLVVVPGNDYSIQRIWLSQITNETIIQYGQSIHTTEQRVLGAPYSESVVFHPSLTPDRFRCFLLLQMGETDLTNTQFVPLGRFGDALR